MSAISSLEYEAACRDATRPVGAGMVGDKGARVPVSATMEETPVLAALEGGVLTLTLNRPQRLNAMSQPLIAALSEQLGRARADAAVRAVMITGTGRGFCAGADLAASGTGGAGADGKPDVGAVLEKMYNPMIRAIRELPKPVIAAVNGVAAGGGANLALSCDIVLAARSARFDQAFVRISLMPDLGGTWFLPHVVGDARARALAMLGTSVPAEQAERMGMVWQVVDDDKMMEEATRLARKLAAGPTLSYAAIKKAMNAAGTNSLDQQLDLERDCQRELGHSADFKEGVAAFLAKRPANFAGR
jgi:2-(1,2-epoxy-1,2-dihydrophenyl)acetyl-CoA isomerase